LISVSIEVARVAGERYLQEDLVFARFNRTRRFIAAWVIAGTITLLGAAVALAQTPYSH
jgi:hypothetical protein